MRGFVVPPGMEVEIPWILKAPGAILDYWLDWGSWLAAGETIISAVWTIPTGIVRNESVIDGGLTRIWMTGGTVGTDYSLSVHIVTSAGRQDERSLVLKARAR